MKSVRKYVAYLLLLVLPLSAWASTGTLCAQNSRTESGAETAMVDAHAHHDAGPSATDGPTGHTAHHAAADASADSSPGECPCCDDCEAACMLSSCNPVALATAFGLIAFSGAAKHIPSADAFRNGPPPHVLFRPPIVSV